MTSSNFKMLRFPHCLVLVSIVAFAGCLRQSVDRVEWTSMGTVAALQTHDSRQTCWTNVMDAAKKSFANVERLLNAHVETSEINHLAPLPDTHILAVCDKSMRPCYSAAFSLADATRGAFSPRWRGDSTLDLGAIAKGFAVDLACDEILGRFPNAEGLVDLGGNLRAIGGSWRTGVKNPNGEGFSAVVELRAGEALATSATYYRGDHIVDARTGRPVTNDVASVTVLCRSAMWADGLSTALFVLGPDDGKRFLSEAVSSSPIAEAVSSSPISEAMSSSRSVARASSPIAETMSSSRSVARASSPLRNKNAISVLWILKDGSHIVYGDHARFQGN